jgi:hypothetical protein
MKVVKLKLLFILIVMLHISIVSMSNAQNTTSVRFSYDMAGNRLTRTVHLPPNNIKKHTGNTETNDSIAVQSSLGDYVITVFPNPTKGALTIEVKGGNMDEKVNTLIFLSNGRQLQSIQAKVGIIPVDMTKYTSGWYILRICIGSETADFKVIKQ